MNRYTLPNGRTSHVLMLADLVLGLSPIVGILVEAGVLKGVGTTIALLVMGVVTRIARQFGARPDPTPYSILLDASDDAHAKGDTERAQWLAAAAGKVQPVATVLPPVTPEVAR